MLHPRPNPFPYGASLRYVVLPHLHSAMGKCLSKPKTEWQENYISEDVSYSSKNGRAMHNTPEASGSARCGWQDSGIQSTSSSKAGSSHHGHHFYLSVSQDDSVGAGGHSLMSPDNILLSQDSSGCSSPFDSMKGACNFKGITSSQGSPIDSLEENSKGAHVLKDSASNISTMQPLVESPQPLVRRAAAEDAEKILLEQTRQAEGLQLPPSMKSSCPPRLDTTLFPQNGVRYRFSSPSVQRQVAVGCLSRSRSFQNSLGTGQLSSPQRLPMPLNSLGIQDRDRRETDDSALSSSPAVTPIRSYEGLEDPWTDVRHSKRSIDTSRSTHSSMSSNLQSLQKTKSIVLSSETVVWIASTGQQLKLSEPEDLKMFQDSHGTTLYPKAHTPGSRDCKMFSTSYLKLYTLGRGSFGKVSLYEDEDTQEFFAIKRFKKSQLQKKHMGPSSTGLDVCMNEVNIHKQIQGHPNIVSLHKVFDDHSAQCLYMVLEHMANGHVHPPPPSLELPPTPHVQRVQNVVYDVLKGLQYLHERGCVHGDIKPDNIVLNDRNTAKISDFGSAQMVESTSGTCSHAFGTPAFTAPECLHMDTYNGFAADMWALGISVHLMIHGSLPYANLHKSISELHSMIMGEELEKQEIGDVQADDFLRLLLIADPNLRMTAKQALEHPWMLAMCERIATSSTSSSNSPMRHTMGNILQLKQHIPENGACSSHGRSNRSSWYARFNRTAGNTKFGLQLNNLVDDYMSPMSPGTPTGVNVGHADMMRTAG